MELNTIVAYLPGEFRLPDDREGVDKNVVPGSDHFSISVFTFLHAIYSTYSAILNWAIHSSRLRPEWLSRSVLRARLGSGIWGLGSGCRSGLLCCASSSSPCLPSQSPHRLQRVDLFLLQPILNIHLRLQRSYPIDRAHPHRSTNTHSCLPTPSPVLPDLQFKALDRHSLVLLQTENFTLQQTYRQHLPPRRSRHMRGSGGRLQTYLSTSHSVIKLVKRRRPIPNLLDGCRKARA